MATAAERLAEKVRPIVVKKRKVVAAGHHGGAWKVAYADFVTAMMAFFLVMWLVASVSKEQRAAIFDYFKNPSMEPGRSPKLAPGQAGPGGASMSAINLRGGLDAPKSGRVTPSIGLPVTPGSAPNDVDEARRLADEAERKQLQSLLDELKAAIAASQALSPFKDQLLLDITPEGLRIQIVDAQNRAMFDSGSSQLKLYTEDILRELAPYLNSVPNRLSVTGHTDTTPYLNRAGYTNWELSADRANSARRALERGGLAEQKTARVVGLSSAVLFDKANPRNPINRRISIIVMTKRAEEAALKTDVSTEIEPPAMAPIPTVSGAAPQTTDALGAGADGTDSTRAQDVRK